MCYDSAYVATIAQLVKRCSPPAWTRDLTEKQKRVYNCPARFKRALAARQSGKSHVAAAWTLGGPANKNTLVFARTAAQVRGIYIEPYRELNERYGLDLDISESKLEITEPNGHTIHMLGLRDAASAEKLRGQRFVKVVADEMGTYKTELIQWIIQSVLTPTLLKNNGELLAVGTPGVIPEGFWYDITAGENQWPVDFGAEGWTMWDNPHIPNPDAFLADVLASGGYTVDTPYIQREYFAHWVRDSGGLIYQFNRPVEPAPQTGTTVLGIDIGYDDGCGFVVARMNERPHVYVLRAFTTSQSLPQEIMAVIKQLCAQFNVNYIFADTGGGGKMTVEMLKQNFRLPVESAKTTGEQGKRANIDFVRGMIKCGTLHLCEPTKDHDGAKELLQEWSVLPWSEDRSEHCPGFQDELSDALIYALKAFLQTDGPAKVAPTDPVALENERRRKAAQAAARKNTRQRWKAQTFERAGDSPLFLPLAA
jgi:hypothetical protein